MASVGKRRGLRFWLLYGAFVVLLVEVALRIVLSIPGIESRLAVNDDSTWRRHWVARHSAEVEVYYPFDRYDPALGWFMKPNLRNLPVFENQHLSTNARGLRGERDFSYEKDPARPRLLILGDSFTFGDGVSDDETYAAQLQRMLPNVDVINMGVHGYGHDQMLLLLLEEGLRYHPDVVLLGFLPLDMERNVVGFRDYAKPRFVVSGDDLVLTGSPVPSPDRVLRWDWLRPRLLDALSMLDVGMRTRSGSREQEEQEVTRRILDRMIQAVTSAGAVAVIAYLPYGMEIASSTPSAGEAFLLSYCASNPGVRCFSARPQFLARIAAGTTFEGMFHWDRKGHQTVAEAVFDFLVRKQRLLRPAVRAAS